ncbi:MAG TPA: 50S ribosomal L9 C-terminal domain-containing protein, partial [Candidatus Limnocylindrales bacterium]|nr:50S ribosomal L9 C-terminal domain-containing protein [Candidatus Limnocylindrales bacterium]
ELMIEKMYTLGIDGRELERDMEVARRLLPLPIRSLARRGIDVDRHRIDLEEPLRQLGTYKVAIRVAPEMISEVTVAVEPKG